MRIVGADLPTPEHVVRTIERARTALRSGPEMLRAIADEIQGWTWDPEHIAEQIEQRRHQLAEMVGDLQEKRAILLNLAESMRPQRFQPPYL